MSKYNFSDPVIMGKAMKLIKESNASYYIDGDGEVLIRYNKQWVSYEYAEGIYPKEFTIK